jgi:hypothetical protein
MTQALHPADRRSLDLDAFNPDLWSNDPLASLRAFTGILTAQPIDMLIDVIRQACLRGYGFWQEPPDAAARDKIRPATHLYEIALFGVTGIGADAAEAARSWHRAAMNTLAAAPDTTGVAQ